MSDEEDDETILVAARTDQADTHVKGTRGGYTCAICKCALSLAPAGQKFIAANPDAPTLCIACAQKKCGGIDKMKAQPAPGAIEELIEDLIGRAKRHQSN